MAKEKINFQDKQAELEQILGELQQGSLTVDQSIEKYKQANQIIDQLEKYLAESQNQIAIAIESQTKK